MPDTENRDSVRIAGRYVLGAELGRGATGIVYAAWDEFLARHVAVKMFAAAGGEEELVNRDRFLTEARSAAGLSDPHLVPVHDLGVHEDVPYLVMELLAGGSFAAELETAQPSVARACEVVAGVCRGLATAHQDGVLHRDIKAANVLLTRERQPKLGDFGLAKSMAAAGLTRTGNIVGTIAYLAPERLESQPATSASDMWSVGVLLYESLAGRKPFVADSPAAMVGAIHTRSYPPLAQLCPDLPPSLVDVVARCLDYDLARRPPASDVAAVLAAVLTDLPSAVPAAVSAASPTGQPDKATHPTEPHPESIQPPRRLGRRGVLAVVAGAGLVGMLAAAIPLVMPVIDRCGEDRLPLVVAASPEKADVMEQLVEDYEARRPEVEGRCVRVVLMRKSSGVAMTALAEGRDSVWDGQKPDVWSPASSVWLKLLRESATLGAAQQSIAPADAPSIASSPLVIAMPRPMAEALGWPDKELGWSDLLDLGNNPAGWGTIGRPEWGTFRLGKTNPNISTSGLNATIGTYFAATGHAGNLTEGDLENPKVQSFVRGVERSIDHYADNTLDFLANLLRADAEGGGLSYVSAVAVEEKSVWDYNQGNPMADPALRDTSRKPNIPLVAIYPKEGTLYSDNPYVTLNASWVSEAKRKAAADFLTYLQSDAAQRRFQDYAFRDYTHRAGPLATRANGLLPAEPPVRLLPPQPSVLSSLLTKWESLRKQANVLFVMDTSGSMADPIPGMAGVTKLVRAKDAATNSLAHFADGDQVSLWMFSTQVDGQNDHREVVPLGPANRDSGTLLKDRINGLQARGGTGLYDTSLAAFRHMVRQQKPDTVNAVVLLTDGRNDDDIGIKNVDELVTMLHAEPGGAGIRLFTIAYGKDADHDALTKIAKATNAKMYDSTDPGSIDAIFASVVANFGSGASPRP